MGCEVEVYSFPQQLSHGAALLPLEEVEGLYLIGPQRWLVHRLALLYAAAFSGGRVRRIWSARITMCLQTSWRYIRSGHEQNCSWSVKTTPYSGLLPFLRYPQAPLSS